MQNPSVTVFLKGPFLFSLVLVIGGCASTGSVTAPPKAEPVARAPTTPPDRYQEPEIAAYRPPVQVTPARPQPARAVQSLLKRAEAQQAAGELVAAANTLERALRIEPQNALLWNRLAHVRFDQGRYQQAASLASKSKALAGGDPGLRADNDDLIRRARAGY